MSEHEVPNPDHTRRVIVGVDGSDDAARASLWAAAEASARGASLGLVHALDLPHRSLLTSGDDERVRRRRRDGGELLAGAERTVREAFPGLATDTALEDASAVHALRALSADAALLVTGSRGRGGFTGMLLGSVSRRLAAHAPCPLVVVRSAQAAEPDNQIVVGVEDEHSESAIAYGLEAAERCGAGLHAIGSRYPRAGYYGPLGTFFGDVDLIRGEVERALRTLLDPLRAAHPDVPVQITAGRGNPVPLLVEAARKSRLLVIGAHRHESPLSLGIGYVVDGVLAHSPAPVAVVPAAA